MTAFDPQQLSRNPTAWDQINVADILVSNCLSQHLHLQQGNNNVWVSAFWCPLYIHVSLCHTTTSHTHTHACYVSCCCAQVGSKADAATPEAAAAFQAWAADELFPPKSHVLLSAEGQLDPSWLHVPRSAASAAGLLLKTSAHSSRARKQQQTKLQQQQQQDATQPRLDLQAAATVGANEDTTPSTQQPQPGKPHRVLGQPSSSTAAAAAGSADSRGTSVLLQHYSCGWVSHESDVFDRERLLQVLQALQPVVARMKGVFRVGPKQWVMPAAVAPATPPAAAAALEARSDSAAAAAGGGGPAQGGSESEHACRAGSSSTLQLQEVCYRGPSMAEVILPPQGWQQAAMAAAAASAALGGAGGAAAQQLQQASSCSLTDNTAQTEQQEKAAAAFALRRLALQDEQQSDAAAVAAAAEKDVWMHIEAAFQACVQPC